MALRLGTDLAPKKPAHKVGKNRASGRSARTLLIIEPSLKLSFPHFLLDALAVVVNAILGTEVQVAVEGDDTLANKPKRAVAKMAPHTALPGLQS